MLSENLYVIEAKKGVWQVRVKQSHLCFSTAFSVEEIKRILKTLINRYKDYPSLQRAIGRMEYNKPLKAEVKVKREKELKGLDPKVNEEFYTYMKEVERAMVGNTPLKVKKKLNKVTPAPTSKVDLKPKKKLINKKVDKKPVEAKIKPLGLKRRLNK